MISLSNNLRRNLIIVILIAYPVFHAINFALDPLILAPQLDAKENLLWATMIDSGSLPNEPFYRAMVYPWILSLVNPQEVRPFFALILGITCHLINGFLVFNIADRIWASKMASWVSVYLYTLNPVALFFASQVMDMTLGITFFLTGLWLLFQSKVKVLPTLIGGIFLGLAILVRPHFLPVVLVLPLALAIFEGKKRYTLAWIPIISLLIIQGTINTSLSGDFKILPSQGVYNLYAANRPGANGLYYKQLVDVSGENFINPARAESEKLYIIKNDANPPIPIDEINRYWRNETIKIFTHEPLRILKLWTYKGLAVLNSYEQYNNLTYSFHKERLSFLRYNPINFGIILILAMVGSFSLWNTNRSRLLTLLVVISGYSVSLIFFYASARFRLPLVPILTILAAGVFSEWSTLKSSRAKQFMVLAISLLTGFVTFNSFGNIRNKDTYIQDRLLMANANADLGRDYDAATIANAVLWEQPNRKEALRIYTISYFNMQLVQNEAVQTLGSWEDQKKWVVQSVPTDPIQDAILGIYQWQWGNQDVAHKIWTDIQLQNNEGSSLAKACLTALSGSQHTDPMVIALRGIFQSK